MSDWSEGVFDGGAAEIAKGAGLSSGLSSFLGGASSFLGPAGALLGGGLASPSTATAINNGKFEGSPFDSSGWNVNFGSGSISSDNNPLSKYLPMALVGVALILGVKYLKRRG